MPYKTDKQKLGDPFLKRSCKLLPCQKEMVLYWTNQGLSQRKLAKLFNCSRRLITFIQDPKKKEDNLKRRNETGGSKQYYNRKKHNAAMKDHRRYKHKILPTGDFQNELNPGQIFRANTPIGFFNLKTDICKRGGQKNPEK